MQLLAKLVAILFYISTVLNVLVFFGTVVELLKHYVGFFAYILGIFAAPLFSPAILALPWFSAWVDSSDVNTNLSILWASWFVLLILRVTFSKFARI